MKSPAKANDQQNEKTSSDQQDEDELIKSISDCYDSKDLSHLNANKITKFYEVPGPRFQNEKEIVQYHGYELVEKIAEGGFGQIYTATHIKTKIKVACKKIDLKKNSKSRMDNFRIEDMKNELVILKKVHNPYIVKLYAHFVANTNLYIFLKYANHATLTKHIENKGPLKERDSKCFFAQILVGIEHMHSLNIAHRDIKPDNILMQLHPNKKLTVLITDFGLSRLIHVDQVNGTVELNTTSCGTGSYMSPELLLEKPYNAFLADIWALGVTLFYMVSKKLPFDDKNSKQQAHKQNKREWQLNEKIAKKLSEQFMNFLEMMLEPEYQSRPTITKLVEHVWIVDEYGQARNYFEVYRAKSKMIKNQKQQKVYETILKINDTKIEKQECSKNQQQP